MKIVRNKQIPSPDYKAINLFGVLFVRGNANIDEITIRHERIHTAQMKEMLYVFFYLFYFLEWLVRLFLKRNAYRNISFEREAYANQNYPNYLDERRWYSWCAYYKRV